MMTSVQLHGLLQKLWADPEPGLEWDGMPDHSLDSGGGWQVETWHTPHGTVVARHRDDEDAYLVEVTGP